MSKTFKQIHAARHILEAEIACFAELKIEEFSKEHGVEVYDLSVILNPEAIIRPANKSYHLHVKALVKV